MCIKPRKEGSQTAGMDRLQIFLRCQLLIPMFQRTEMSFDSTHFLDQLADLRNNRDDADVTLDCQGELVKAHFFILATRFDCTFSKLQ